MPTTAIHEPPVDAPATRARASAVDACPVVTTLAPRCRPAPGNNPATAGRTGNTRSSASVRGLARSPRARSAIRSPGASTIMRPVSNTCSIRASGPGLESYPPSPFSWGLNRFRTVTNPRPSTACVGPQPHRVLLVDDGPAPDHHRHTGHMLMKRVNRRGDRGISSRGGHGDSHRDQPGCPARRMDERCSRNIGPEVDHLEAFSDDEVGQQRDRQPMRVTRSRAENDGPTRPSRTREPGSEAANETSGHGTGEMLISDVDLTALPAVPDRHQRRADHVEVDLIDLRTRRQRRFEDRPGTAHITREKSRPQVSRPTATNRSAWPAPTTAGRLCSCGTRQRPMP